MADGERARIMGNSKKLHLIMPMGGAGSRFFNDGFIMPKPLIQINGRPFLYWATMSVKKYVDIADLTFVVLQEHIDAFCIDKEIIKWFPEAKIVVIPKLLPGAVMTCLEGLMNISDELPVLFNDCDHMFRCSSFSQAMNAGEWDFDGALLTFPSNQPQFSYVRYGDDGVSIVGTVEKKVVSNQAICGAYVVRHAQLFRMAAEQYLTECDYSEYFVSGIYNVLCQKGRKVCNYQVDFHVPFGTPTEYKTAQDSEYFSELM